MSAAGNRSGTFRRVFRGRSASRAHASETDSGIRREHSEWSERVAAAAPASAPDVAASAEQIRSLALARAGDVRAMQREEIVFVHEESHGEERDARDE